MPGYTGANVQERPKNVEKNACLTLKNLEMILVRYIVDEYNQKADARMKNQSKIGRWEAGFMIEPNLYEERELDICLMKQTRRTIQRYGTIQLGNITYKSAHLQGRAGEVVAIRFDPDDITTLLIYEKLADGTEEFLDYAHAQGLETERLSLRELKAINKQLNQDHEAINNNAVLEAMLERQVFVEELSKNNRQERRQIAHEEVNPVKSVAEKFAISVPETEEFEEEEEDELPSYQVTYIDDIFDD